MKTKIVGTEFAKAKAENIKQGSQVTIYHDPENKFDENALAVIFNDERIGYIGKGTDVYDLPRAIFPKNAFVIDFYIKADDDEKFKRHDVGCLVSCNIEIPNKSIPKIGEEIASFNEEGVVINFDEESHTYTYKGQILKGATTYIKKYEKEFDAETASANCEKYWQIPAKTIKDAWKLSGDLARSFGTGVHKALEFEDLYRSYKKPKDGSRCFLIKNPAIQSIVEEFYKLNERLGFKGDVVPEALVSDVENGNCGLADRILVTDWDKKICRVQDYKVNYDFNVKGQVNFKNLPDGVVLETTKLSKLALQLKQHRTMLEKSGWTVEGVDGFVYDGKWNYYEVNTLDGFDIANGTFN